MIAPLTLAQLVAADPLGAVKAAISTRLAALLPGITVVSHPGKLDISEVVEKSVVATPGIAVGWSRVRGVRIIDGGYHVAIEWTAYVVVEDKAINDRRVDREALGLAIGGRLMAILADPEAQTWGLGNVLPPAADPRPELRPMFTVRDAARGAAYYAVTWTQTVVDQGASLFAGETPGLDFVDGCVDVSFPAGIPPEVLALLEIEEEEIEEGGDGGA